VAGNETYIVPWVYTPEVPIGGEPLQPAGSSAYAPIGTAEWGPMNVATLITSWPRFVATFGSDMTNGYLAMGVRDFFRMGGQRAWVTRTCHYSDITDATTLTAVKALVTLISDETTPQDLFTATALYYGSHGNDIRVTVENVDAAASTFDLVVSVTNGNTYRVVERWRDVTLDSTSTTAFIEDIVNDHSLYVVIDVSIEDQDPLEASYNLVAGDDGLTSIADADYIGDEASHTGLYALDAIHEILTINHPGITAVSVLTNGQNYVYSRFARRQIDFYIGDLPLNYTPAQALTFVGDNLPSNGYEAYYYPWVKEGTLEKPVSPFMAGVYAKNDFIRGVWQAPAGVSFPLPITDVCYDVNWGDMSVLNPHGINSIDQTQFEGFLPWGTRTLDVQTHFRYIPVRRFVNVIKKTLHDGCVQFVFEGNAPALWERIEDTAHRLLMYYHSIGAFAGKTPEASFFAKCDATTNPPELIDQGIATCQVGICPLKPAEFIVFPIMVYNEGVLPIATTGNATS